MDKGWPSIWKSCKIKVRPESQRKERPSFNLDAVKISLQCPVSRCKLREKEEIHWSEPKMGDERMAEEAVQPRESNSTQSDYKQATTKANQKVKENLDITRFLAVSSIANTDEPKEHRKKEIHSASNYLLSGDNARTVDTDRIQSKGKINPRKIYLGGGFYNAIAIYDRNAKLDIIKVGETRLGFMDCVINKKEQNVKKTPNNCLPKVRNTSELDGVNNMPHELRCGKISEKIVKAKSSPRAASTCRICQQVRKGRRDDDDGPKQIKLFLSIDL